MMPTIILTSAFSWTPFWAIIASGIVAVIAITALLAVVTDPRRRGAHRHTAAAPPHG
jgi:multidrug efflux pump subunit AcrB